MSMQYYPLKKVLISGCPVIQIEWKKAKKTDFTILYLVYPTHQCARAEYVGRLLF